ncbi:Hypothetical predicted protein [Mytilus galloprovincialis]|uniref:Uncharacterized protein n=1 Tax=Mytilus galloprovincialis TaxID=29158 RepID=A0A8B6GE89_MYTGA|nr:Hypothetical predicted protein [Mytilus galloprovincialis]
MAREIQTSCKSDLLKIFQDFDSLSTQINIPVEEVDLLLRDANRKFVEVKPQLDNPTAERMTVLLDEMSKAAESLRSSTSTVPYRAERPKSA